MVSSLQDQRIRDLFASIKQIRQDWAFSDDAGQAPLNMEPDDSAVEEDAENYEEETPNEHEPENAEKLERKGAKSELGRSKSSLSNASKETLSPANSCLKGLGIDVEMTPEQEAELHAILKQINELDPKAPSGSYTVCIMVSFRSISIISDHFKISIMACQPHGISIMPCPGKSQKGLQVHAQKAAIVMLVYGPDKTSNRRRSKILTRRKVL